jgi:hypothetical protein
MLSELGYQLREILAEQGYEITPKELEESIDDAINLDELIIEVGE